jgi:hypothetical protein
MIFPTHTKLRKQWPTQPHLSLTRTRTTRSHCPTSSACEGAARQCAFQPQELEGRQQPAQSVLSVPRDDAARRATTKMGQSKIALIIARFQFRGGRRHRSRDRQELPSSSVSSRTNCRCQQTCSSVWPRCALEEQQAGPAEHVGLTACAGQKRADNSVCQVTDHTPARRPLSCLTIDWGLWTCPFVRTLPLRLQLGSNET